jgi:hypothetical protein
LIYILQWNQTCNFVREASHINQLLDGIFLYTNSTLHFKLIFLLISTHHKQTLDTFLSLTCLIHFSILPRLTINSNLIFRGFNICVLYIYICVYL